jgi:GDPmannose 4,6-dehydratase
MTNLNKKIAIISGVNGQDGSYLAEHLLNMGYFVVGLKRRTSTITTQRIDHIYSNPNFKLEYYDLNDASACYRYINQYKPNEIYNLAAQSHVKVSFDVPSHTVDGIVQGTLNWLEAIRNTNTSIKFYQASSSEMFGDSPIIKETGYDEYSPLSPVSPYAAAKVCAHNLVSIYRRSYGIHACSGILFNHESPRRGETFVTRKITIAAAKIKLGLQKELRLGNLTAKRDWGFAGDYVKAMHLMLQHQNPSDYVIATGKTHSIEEFLKEVFDYAELDYNKYLIIDPKLFRPIEVPFLLGDSSRAMSHLNWKPSIDMKQLAHMMYDEDLKLLQA